MFSLLLLSSLLHITTCTVYTVTPDDHYYPNTTCHHCHNLQHYLLNVTKYFTSNTQLLFLPGLHHLHTDLIIQNVHNISLIGSTANSTTPGAIIQSNASILILNLSKLIIKHILINTNYTDQEVLSYLPKYVPLTIKDCSFVSLYCLQVHRVIHSRTHKHLYMYNFAIVAINIMAISYFNYVKCYDEMQLFYNETHTDREQHTLSINNCTVRRIKVDMLQNYYRVILRIMNIRLEYHRHHYASFIRAEKLGTNKVLIMNCRFVSNFRSYMDQMFFFASTSNGSVELVNCQFINNGINLLQTGRGVLVRLRDFINIKVTNCNFHSNSEETILQTYGEEVNQTNVIIRNTNFTATISDTVFRFINLITLLHTTLSLMDSVSFHFITTFSTILFLEGNSTIIISGTITFSKNFVDTLIDTYDNNIQYIIMKEGSILNISHNVLATPFHTKLPIAKYPFPFCYFQYFTSKVRKVEERSFLIRLHNNYKIKPSNYRFNFKIRYNIPITNCLWLEKSLFQNNDDIPLQVNNRYTQFTNDSGTYTLTQLITQSSLCVCTNVTHHDCHINDLGYLYPGQTSTIFLHHKRVSISYIATAVSVKTDIIQQYVTPCIVLDITENIQFISENCTELHYTIGFPTDNWCELFLKIASDSDEYLNIFYIRQITCPNGFVKIDKRCQCDPVLVQYGITNCNINDQTIPRPANSWIYATTHNNSYTYHISLHCPFHYCLPHSSHLNFSTPNSQCQFKRSGLLCGHCQQGLSTVFGSSNCQQCSKIFLLLIISITMTGLLLVLMLFALNLTVTDGIINGFILYVNIISINIPVIFTDLELNHLTATYTFISLANLDLGIQTCFYNGMDDYAKMWLQLAFPFYLIFIATLIIITSRYSTTIQRLTARRALPVLATLFLLSYTKILRIVSSVLFFYSTITHLPSKHTTLVWSVDANVPLFGVRFTILFIVCLILFLILVPFNVILLFTRTLSRFRFINKFKPLLDAYQGPYKNKFYYWTGLQLLMRAVFFGISSLDRNINIAISILLLSAIIGLHGMMQPLNVKYKNYQEMLLFFNLQGIYVSLLCSQDNANSTTINVAITLAAFHFSFIVMYHMITYVYGGVIRNRIQLSINRLTRWITRLKNRTHTQQFQLQDSIRDNIPEVAFNYHEYREPLVGIDC